MTKFGNDVVTYDGRGRISKFGSKSYTYDNYGNRTSDGTNTYAWVRGRLLSAVGGASFTYNADGRRCTKAYGGVTATYYYDEDMLLGENRSDGKKLRYFYDGEGMCGFRYYNGSAWAEYVYVKNAKGDVLAILNGSGTVVANYSYDAWGNCTIESQTNGMGDINPIRYRGYYYDGETGLYYLLTRYYDPTIGHFISPDGFEYLDPETIGTINLYAYCRYNPVMYSDPTGNIPFANGFTMFYSDIFVGGFYDKTWGQMSYNVVVNHGQTDETGLLYSVAGIDNISGSKKVGAGINVWGWLGIEGGYTADKNSKFNGVYLSANITPWLSGGININSNGIAVSIGISIDNTTHEIRVGIGWNLLMIGLSFLAVILTGGAVAAMLA